MPIAVILFGIEGSDVIIMIKPIIPQVNLGIEKASVNPTEKTDSSSFERIFQDESEKQNGVKFSAHAQQRLESRQIQLSEEDKSRLGNAVDRATEKGANQSLVLLDDLALVVSVRNRTVITALDETKAKSGVFTNIDSAVIA